MYESPVSKLCGYVKKAASWRLHFLIGLFPSGQLIRDSHHEPYFRVLRENIVFGSCSCPVAGSCRHSAGCRLLSPHSISARPLLLNDTSLGDKRPKRNGQLAEVYLGFQANDDCGYLFLYYPKNRFCSRCPSNTLSRLRGNAKR